MIQQPAKKASYSILLAWLLAGTLDITAASIQYYSKTGKGPGNIFRYIARAAFGKDTVTDSNMLAVYGLAFHYLIALLFTLFFFWLYPKWSGFAKNKIITGLGYGLFAWLVMNLLVVPASKIGKWPSDATQAIIGAVILMCCIGLPISLVIGRYYEKNTGSVSR